VGVMANSDLLLAATPDLAPEVRERLVTIKRAARSAADLTRQLLVYAGRGQGTLRPVQLDGLIEQSMRLHAATARAGIELSAELDSKAHWIHADAGQVQQVVGNLLTNALEALGESPGRVEVRTRFEQLDARALARFAHEGRAKPGSFIVLEVEDTGAGIDAARLSRIFEPFYTSKFTGRGLGLASVLGIVRSHRAALHVRSAPGQGSIFEIAWPLAIPPALSEQRPPSSPPALPWKGAGQVLVVDDDPSVLQALTGQMAQLGFAATPVASGAEAIELLRAGPFRFRLAVVDQTMPDLCGDRVIERFHELEPTLPVVLVSGCSEAEAVADRERVAFVAKPMTLCDLQQAFSRLLGAA
jgi:two-component system cell cycle sensor histidine kinase/response regulator CckA